MSPYFKARCLRFQGEGVSSTPCHSYAGINTLEPCFTVHFVESSYNFEGLKVFLSIMFCEYEYMVQVSLSDVEDLKRRPSAPQARHIISPDTDERGAEPTFIGTSTLLLLLVLVFMRID
jgi:hypothetical protein